MTEISGLPIAIAIRILSARPALLGVISGVCLALLPTLVWKYAIDYTLIEMEDSLYLDFATIGGKNRARSLETRRKYVE